MQSTKPDDAESMNANARGALLMVLAMAGFVLNDALIKSLQSDIPVAQVIAVRGVLIVLLLSFLLYRQRRQLPAGALAQPLLWLRGGADVLATFAFIAALRHLPFASISAILQAIPLAVTAGAAWFLGEAVGWRRYVAISAGLVGVLLVIKPGLAGFNQWSVLAVVVVLAATVRDLLTRRLPAALPSLAISLANAVMVCAAGWLFVALSRHWVPIPSSDLLKLALAALFLLVGYHAIVMAMRLGEVSVISPFRYCSLLWAVLIGYSVFGEIPDALTLMGSAIIVLSGLYSFHRERVLARRHGA